MSTAPSAASNSRPTSAPVMSSSVCSAWASPVPSPVVIVRSLPLLSTCLQPSSPPSVRRLRRKGCFAYHFRRQQPISALLVAGVAEVHQFPDRLVLVRLDQLTTAIS